MNIRTLFILILLNIPFLSHSTIIETPHIADVAASFDKDTWVLVDLDNTLFEAKQALGHANWFYAEVQKRVEQGMNREEAIADVYPLWAKVQKICPVKPLEKNFIYTLLRLQNQGVTIIGLTHRWPSIAQTTLQQVKSLGIEFLTTAPSQETFDIPAEHSALYTQGILFVSDYNKKGDIFPSFLRMIGQKPSKCIFIDDRRDNVEELEQALTELNIEYLGVHYTAKDHVPPVYSPELAQFQYQFVEKIMSNETALFLMENEVK